MASVFAPCAYRVATDSASVVSSKDMNQYGYYEI